MIRFFGNPNATLFAVQTAHPLPETATDQLSWLFGDAPALASQSLLGTYLGPRAAMVTPWSTNAVEITQNMGIDGIVRIEEFSAIAADFKDYDPMLMQRFEGLDQDIFNIDIEPAPIEHITDIAAYNEQEGLALSPEEVDYLNDVSQRIGRPLTDAEVFGFSQVNSEHCRHKIFNGTFVIDGQEKPMTLFQMIKRTSKEHPNTIVSAYKDNVAFVAGPEIQQFAPTRAHEPSFFGKRPIKSVISLKAETHNFPTTVEPFNGAATGSGGEIRDRLAGGKGAIPLAGTAVYMTAYSRLSANRPWEQGLAPRPWLYQTPLDILIKASNGASDFGNKFGQPLIAGSCFTFEHQEHGRRLAYDKVIMLAGGVGYGNADQALKDKPQKGDKIVIMGGDNYRIGMGGAAVSSADTGEFGQAIELNAIQRSNPEMQKRVANAIRSLVEQPHNPIVSIHDHGAGGHLNCLSELVEETGGHIDLAKLPVGDPTLSAKEIIGNESQERMGLVIGADDLPQLEAIAARERAPMYVVGDVTDDHRFIFRSSQNGETPMDLALGDMFGSSPVTYMHDHTVAREYSPVPYDSTKVETYIEQVLQLESVACKDWLTSKVDRCVGGLVAKQQTAGELQLPLNNVGVMSLDFDSFQGVATSIGHSPISGLIDPVAGAQNSIAEALTNLVFAPLEQGLASVSLSANWMWPCRNEGEDARLYDAVEAVSELAVGLGINVPTGKDSLSMKQKYPDGDVLSPGTVIISAVGHCSDITRIVEPVAKAHAGSLYCLDWSQSPLSLGGSAFAQVRNAVGDTAPRIADAAYFKSAFDAVQALIKAGQVAAGHDISDGGLITTLLELCFPSTQVGLDLDLPLDAASDLVTLLFAENAGVVLQAVDDATFEQTLNAAGVHFVKLGRVTDTAQVVLRHGDATLHTLDVAALRDVWYRTSFLFDQQQRPQAIAQARYDNYKVQPLTFQFPAQFTGDRPVIDRNTKRPVAAVLREKGSNSERELANALYLAGFEVKDVHMTDLISGRETLEDVQFLGAVGGFSNSDVLGSAKGWAGAFKYNAKAKATLDRFFAREDVLSIGICNGCQLFVELNVIYPEHAEAPKMLHNDSRKHECQFTSVDIHENHSVMLSSLAGSRLGIWISHGEGKFSLPLAADQYHIPATYGYADYPSNPNGSDHNAAMLVSKDGRHLVTMPHLERSIFQWNWAHYPDGRTDAVSPWLEAFVNARQWIEQRQAEA